MFRIFMTIRSDYRLEKLALMNGGLKSYSQHGQVFREWECWRAHLEMSGWVGAGKLRWRSAKDLSTESAHESLLSVPWRFFRGVFFLTMLETMVFHTILLSFFSSMMDRVLYSFLSNTYGDISSSGCDTWCLDVWREVVKTKFSPFFFSRFSKPRICTWVTKQRKKSSLSAKLPCFRAHALFEVVDYHHSSHIGVSIYTRIHEPAHNKHSTKNKKQGHCKKDEKSVLEEIWWIATASRWVLLHFSEDKLNFVNSCKFQDTLGAHEEINMTSPCIAIKKCETLCIHLLRLSLWHSNCCEKRGTLLRHLLRPVCSS